MWLCDPLNETRNFGERVSKKSYSVILKAMRVTTTQLWNGVSSKRLFWTEGLTYYKSQGYASMSSNF